MKHINENVEILINAHKAKLNTSVLPLPRFTAADREGVPHQGTCDWQRTVTMHLPFLLLSVVYQRGHFGYRLEELKTISFGEIKSKQLEVLFTEGSKLK